MIDWIYYNPGLAAVCAVGLLFGILIVLMFWKNEKIVRESNIRHVGWQEGYQIGRYEREEDHKKCNKDLLLCINERTPNIRKENV